MTDPVRNFAITTVTTAPSPASSGTTLEPADATLFPDPDVDGAFNVIVWPTATQPLATNAEIIRVTGLAAGVWTHARAQEGTDARTILVGDQVMLGPTAKTITDLAAAGGLPPNWTLGGDAEVNARADDPGLTPFGVQGLADQTAPYFEVLATPGGDDLLSVGSDGKLTVSPLDAATDMLAVTHPTDGSFRVGRGEGHLFLAEASSAADDGIFVIDAGAASGDFDYLRCKDALAAIVTRINKGGYLMFSQNAAPADADLNTGELALWFDPTEGAAKLMIKAKDEADNVVTGTVSLS